MHIRLRKARRSTPAIALLLALTNVALSAQADPVEEAETLARAVYYEGPPEDAARALPDAGVARLGEMLMDPAEADHHGTIVSLLGKSEHPDAFAALAGYAAQPVAGEVDRNTFRARTRLPGAMGRLAHSDRRALGWLLARSEDRAAPAWSFRHQRGAKLAAMLEDQNLSGLALTGAPEALAALRRAEREARGADRRRNVARVMEIHGAVARDGLDAVREEVAR